MPEEMPEKARQLFLIFRDAVQREREAQITYKRAAELCEDTELIELLLGFYKDEVRHEEALVEQYNLLRDRYSAQAE
jgi:rubrerythrin